MADYDVPPVNVPVKSFIYDGYLTSVAVPLVKWFKESRGFTLRDWPSSGEYYNFFFSYWNKLLTEIRRLLREEEEINEFEYEGFEYEGSREEKLELIDRMDEALRSIKERRMATPGVFLFAFFNALLVTTKYGSGIETYDIPKLAKRFHPKTSRERLEEFFIKAGSQFHGIAPFLSRTGLFGLNTYLYLFFNGIHPVAISIEPHTVHGDLNDPLEITIHDLQHVCGLSRIVDVSESCRGETLDPEDIAGIVIDEQVKRNYFEKLKNIYLDVIHMPPYMDKEIKGYLLILFFFTHETSEPIYVDISADADLHPIILDLIDPSELGIPKPLVGNNLEKYQYLSFLELQKRFLSRFGRRIYGDDIDSIMEDLGRRRWRKPKTPKLVS